MYSLLDLLTIASQGLAPYGLRHSGEGVKGKGYFGLLANPNGGMSTEVSSEDEKGEFPLLAPTLTKQEIDLVLSGAEPTDEIYKKAMQWADFRRSQGLSPFASPTELRIPAGLLD
jgi:hypothetical protein